MSRNIRDTPFTEIVETVQDLSRSKSDDKRRIRGIVNRRYTASIPREMDWPFMKSTSSISVTAEYKSGIVTVNTQGTVCTFSGAIITSQMTGRKIKFTNNANIYDFTYTDITGGTIAPSLSLATNVSQGTYTIFRNIYPLAQDFDRFPINGGLLYLSGGQKVPLPEKHDDDYYQQFTPNPTNNPEFCRMLGYDTGGAREFEMVPPPAGNLVIEYEYQKTLPPMKDNTSGTVSITSGGTLVTGVGTLFADANTGDYLRIDGMGISQDSTWHRVDTITNDTTATITPVFRSDSSVATANYTISSSPQYPPKLQEALVYGAVRDIIADQNDPNFIFYHSEYANIITDNKVHIQTRRTNENVELAAEDFNFRR